MTNPKVNLQQALNEMNPQRPISIMEDFLKTCDVDNETEPEAVLLHLMVASNANKNFYKLKEIKSRFSSWGDTQEEILKYAFG